MSPRPEAEPLAVVSGAGGAPPLPRPRPLGLPLFTLPTPGITLPAPLMLMYGTVSLNVQRSVWYAAATGTDQMSVVVSVPYLPLL